MDQLLLLIDCLVESHMFARAFNSNHEQRNLLWKAGRSPSRDRLRFELFHCCRLSRKSQTKSIDPRNSQYRVCISNSLSTIQWSQETRIDRRPQTTHSQVGIPDKHRWQYECPSIDRLARESLEYYVTLQSESHRETWTSVLILIFTKFLRLSEERVSAADDIHSVLIGFSSSNISRVKSIYWWRKVWCST